MSPGSTIARVYEALKARVMLGDFAPGERIDPARLSADLNASVTPIRDALHRLSGERLVESWLQEGFRQPLVTEASLRDLYGWSEDLMKLVLRAAERLRQGAIDALPVGSPGGAQRATDIAGWLAQLSPNHEHRAAMNSLNERMQVVRRVEADILTDADIDVERIASAVVEAQWVDARRQIGIYHQRRLRHLPDIAARLRPREGTQITIG